MKIKNYVLFVALICTCLIVTSCGMSAEEFVSTVEEYRIFTEENKYNLKTVYDYIDAMDSYSDNEGTYKNEFSYEWRTHELMENDKYITRLKEETDFVYDEDKEYGVLVIEFTISENEGTKVKETLSHAFVFSIHDDIVKAEGALSYEICTDEKEIQEFMIDDVSLIERYASEYN